MKDGRESPSLHLDLTNFEDGVGSRYVLTSPRSLEACARLEVKPVDLLYKSLEEVREENPEANCQQVNDLYVTQEIDRRRKLEMCRNLRMELIQEDEESDKACSSSNRGYKDFPRPRSPGQMIPRPPFTDLQDPLDTPIRGHRDCSSNFFKDQKNHPPLSTESLQDTSAKGPRDYSVIFTDHESSPSHSAGRHTPQNTATRGYRGDLGTPQKSLSQGDLSQTEEKAWRMARAVERELWASIPKRDKKIGALMMLKHQEEEMSKQKRAQAQQAWDNLKKEEKNIRAVLDRQDWPTPLQMNRRRSWSSQPEQVNMFSHKTLLQDPKTLLKYDLNKAMADIKTKNAFYDNGNHPLEERMIKAFKVKMIKDIQEKKNIQIKNEYEKLRHSRLKEKVDNQAKAEERVRRVSIQQKDQRSHELQEKIVEQRNKDLYEKASKEDEMKLMAQLRVMRLDKEQTEHRKMLARFTDLKIRQAREILERGKVDKAERTREHNSIKESAHQVLKKKVDQEKENQRKETAHVIRMKDRKSDKIRKEKEATVEEGRRIARASFHFREKIREQTKSRTFDQMALQATLNASLLKTIP